MCWMCDNPGRTEEDYLDLMRAKVVRYGWALQHVGGDRLHAPWGYTVGLTEYGLPELVVTGISQHEAGIRLNGPAEGVLVDGPPAPGERRRFADGVLSECVPLPHPEAHLHTAVALYGTGVRALQLVWQDSRGRWPWETGFRGRRGGQPVLGPRIAPAA